MRFAAIALVLAVASIFELAHAQDTVVVAVRKRTAAEDLQLFSQVLNQIRVNHPDSIDSHDLFMAAVEGMVRAADPHSYVIPARRLAPEKEKEYRAGKLFPVPITFSFMGGSAVVVGVEPGSSAALLDILPGDELISIDGKPVMARSQFELDIVLAGRQRTTVALTLSRRRLDGSFVELRREVRREKPDPVNAIPAAFMLDSIAGYVRVTTFMGEKIGSELNDVVARLEKEGMRQLILDLRDNGGGSVDEASRVAGAFLPSGTVVYTAEGRKPDVSQTGKVHRVFWKNEKRYPLVVLINAGTASAAELVAGALQDHDRALIVGQPSFGKALLMQTLPLSDGSLFTLVIGHVKTPCGRIIQRQYREITTREYYRLSRTERDLAGRPTCTTTHGRTVYGGGGIYPDLVLPEADPVPVWLGRAIELDLPLRWVGGYLTENGAAFTTAEALVARGLPGGAIEDFRRFVTQQGIMVPEDVTATKRLERMLLPYLAHAKWGERGFYRVRAAMDPEIEAVRKEFQGAASLLTTR